jgi:hypothetical protein
MGTIMKAGNGESFRNVARARLVHPLWKKPSATGLFIFEGSPNLLGRNWAEGKLDAAVVGAPVMHASGYGAYMTQALNYLQSPVLEAPNQTIIYGVEDIAAASFWPVSNYYGARSASDAAVSNGTFCQMTVSGSQQAYTGGMAHYSGTPGAPTANDVASFARDVSGNARIIAVRSSEPAGTIRCKDMTSGTEAVTTRSTGVRDICPLPLLVGSNYLARDTSPARRMFFAAIFSEALSDTDLNNFVAWKRAYWARRGIAV